MRPILLGMNVPVEGYGPLDPDGPTGKRLVEIMGRDAFDEFDRDNVLDRKLWRMADARKSKVATLTKLSGRDVVALGQEVWSAMSLPKCQWLGRIHFNDGWWYRVPHPSGRNRMYNDAMWVAEARSLMRRVANVEI